MRKALECRVVSSSRGERGGLALSFSILAKPSLPMTNFGLVL